MLALGVLVLAAAPLAVGAVPVELRERLKLSPRYTKHVDAAGLPILGSAKVADAAMREAHFIVTSMLAKHPEYLRTLGKAKVRLAVMAPSELTTDIPEHSDLTPKDWWDRRARGLGATEVRPAVSCAEENLLEEPGDPYSTENICVHEFSHALAEMAVPAHQPGFRQKLHAAFEAAQQKGTWKGTYAMTNENEYWAEAVQSWFDTNRHDDHEHGSIDTRDEVKAADPAIAALIAEVFGEVAWRYQKPSQRPAEQLARLGAFPSPLPVFAWPERIARLLQLGDEAPKSSDGGASTSFHLRNAGTEPLQLDWVSGNGERKRYATIAPGRTHLQQTFVGHVWVYSRADKELGWFAAPAGELKLVAK